MNIQNMAYIYNGILLNHNKEQGFSDSSVDKELSVMQETPVRFLGREDPLEKG